jgi:hypothetical protein
MFFLCECSVLKISYAAEGVIGMYVVGHNQSTPAY